MTLFTVAVSGAAVVTGLLTVGVGHYALLNPEQLIGPYVAASRQSERLKQVRRSAHVARRVGVALLALTAIALVMALPWHQ